MNEKALSQWRTVYVAFASFAVQGAAFWWGSQHQSDVMEKMYGNLCWTNVLLVALVAGKALGQHAAKAGGLKSLLGALAGGSTPTPAPEPARAP